MYGNVDSRVSPTGEVDDEDRREMSVSAVVSPTGALTMVGFLAVVDCRSPDLGETIVYYSHSISQCW